MKSLEELASIDRYQRAGDFASLVKNLGRARGNWSQAAALAEATGAPKRTQDILKAAVVGGGTDSNTWGSELAGYPLLVSGFVDALRHSSAFYRLLGDGALVRLPFDVRVGSIATAAGAAIVDPGAAIPVSRMDLASVLLPHLKAAALVVLSQELLDAAGTAAEALISRSLRASVSTAVDAEFIDILIDGVTAGTATNDATESLRSLLLDANLTDASRPYFIASPDTAIVLATTKAVGGGLLFPGVGVTGGTLLGLPLLVSSGVAVATLLLVDASGIGGASDTIVVDASRHAALQMDNAPTMRTGGSGSPAEATATTAVSTWQTNSVAIRCIAYFGAAVIRAGSVTALEDIAWGMGSP